MPASAACLYVPSADGASAAGASPPDNVFLHKENGKTVAKLGDFGLSATLKSQFRSLSRKNSQKGRISFTRLRSAKTQAFLDRTDSEIAKGSFNLTGETGARLCDRWVARRALHSLRLREWRMGAGDQEVGDVAVGAGARAPGGGGAIAFWSGVFASTEWATLEPSQHV